MQADADADADADFRLLNEFQRDFPLDDRPYATIGKRLGLSENAVMESLRRFLEHGEITRIGAVFSPGWLGASTLAAMAVPVARLETVAAQVSRHAQVNHNYQREHRLNLWFVAAAACDRDLGVLLRQIARETGIEVLPLPLLEEFHIDLGFDLATGAKTRALATGCAKVAVAAAPLSDRLRGFVAALQEGLALTERPYAALARRSGMTETEVTDCLGRWQREGQVRRFGVIVRHLELGFIANAMVVWDIPDFRVSALGVNLAAQAGVNLCYRRARHLPQWRHNLYCMIHGRTRAEVERRVMDISDDLDLGEYPREILFSCRRFKQTGARYAPSEVVAHG